MSNKDLPKELVLIISALEELSIKFSDLDEELALLEEVSVIQDTKIKERINVIYEELRFLSRKRKCLDSDRRLISTALNNKLKSETHDQTMMSVEVKTQKQARKMDTFARTRILDATLRDEWNVSCFKELENIWGIALETSSFEIASLAIGKVYVLRKARSVIENIGIDFEIPKALPVNYITIEKWDEEALILVEKRVSKSNRLLAEFEKLKSQLGFDYP